MQEQNRAQTNNGLRRRNRIPALPAIAIILLIGVALGAYFRDPVARLIGRRNRADSEFLTPAATPGQLWTCSMHPQVIQEKPGLCPICHMQLTPLNVGAAEPEGFAEGKEQGTSAQDAGTKKRKIKYWWDPMLSPPYISDHPGKSPMGMDLIPVYEDEVSAGTAVTIDPAVVQNMGVRLVTVTLGPLRRSIRLFGHLDEAQPLIHDVNLRVSGWIQKLHAHTEGMHLQKGDPLFDLYSQELLGAMAEFITVRRAEPTRRPPSGGFDAQGASDGLYGGSQSKLRLLGLTQEQIDRLVTLDRAPETVTFASPVTGHLTEKPVVEGAAVKAGDRVMRIVDHTLLWLDARVFERQLPFIQVGDKASATISSRPGEMFDGEVIFIHPLVDTTTRTATIRITVSNPNLTLRPGMYATVNLTAELADGAVMVPREAIIDTGTQQIAFVTEQVGHFQPRKVTMGLPADDGMVQVLTGLAPGETVVVSGQFLLDTESRLREAIQKYLTEKRQTSAPRPGDEQHTSPLEGSIQQIEQSESPSDDQAKTRLAWIPQIDALFVAYLEIADRFGAVQASDVPLDVGNLVSAAHGLHGALQDRSAKALAERIAREAQALTKQPINRQRELFKALSESTVKLAETSPPSNAVASKLYVMYCSMAPGRWLQRTNRLANPFYASEMKQCGELVKTIEAARGGGA